MKKSRIKEAMKGNKVWCCNWKYNNGGAKPCKSLACPYKTHGVLLPESQRSSHEVRLAKAKELKQCESFWITNKTKHFETGTIVLVHPSVE